MSSELSTRWTTVNFAEAIQGVQTPLGWTFWGLCVETSFRRSFHRLGSLPTAKLPVPAKPDKRGCGIFYGRACANVDVFRWLGDRVPGTSGDALEMNLFGELQGEPRRKLAEAYLRYPVFFAKAPLAAMRPLRELPRKRPEYRAWWQRSVLKAPPRDVAGAQQLIRDAGNRFLGVGVDHSVVSMLGGGFLDRLAALSELAVGDRALARDLATGYGTMEETGLIEDMWRCSRGDLDIDDFIADHGYHGPDEGNVTSPAWREDRRPLEAILNNYRKNNTASPREREAAQTVRRLVAERDLLAGLPASKRAEAKVMMRLAQAFIPTRELGKASFLHAIDAVRCAGRMAGTALAEAGRIDDPEDAFFITFEEYVAPRLPQNLRDRVAERRKNHERYITMTVPRIWSGVPEPILLADDRPDGDAVDLRGVGVVGDTVTGRARVVHNPMDADLDDGDILVCKTTDPSWTPLFMLADALVIDMGGAMSHGAIVARELGVTCVINTITGTRDIPEGATITVDGGTGVVTIDQRP